MQLLADYHMHTPLCRHARGEPWEYVKRAVEIGLGEMGFSDHSPMPEDDFDEWRMYLRQLDEYVAGVEEARRRYPGMVIRLALEVDYIPGHEGWIRELASRHSWDYFIGSVHYLEAGWDIDNPGKLAQWRGRDTGEVWRRYIELLEMAAGSGLFEILGHVDLPKKFGHFPTEEVLPHYERVFGLAARSGVAVELNTAGLRKDCREIYPSRAILEAAFRQGVKITFGSDAHAPEEVGADFGLALELARGVGYRKSCRFAGRSCQEVELPKTV
ncbi:MAG: histidinol-phosphatase HisJ family protein [Limisphaerales bacterium]